MISYKGIVGPTGIVPDNRSVQNSGVGLTELPQNSRPINPSRSVTSNGGVAAAAYQMVQGHPGFEKSTTLSVDWLKNKSFGKR